MLRRLTEPYRYLTLKELTRLTVSAIAAVAKNGVIGANNDIPWRGEVPGEQQLFKEFTLGKVVIMGRNTWESLPPKYRPLPDRFNIVLTRSWEYYSGTFQLDSLEKALMLAEAHEDYDEAVLIGGQRVYEEGLPHCDKIYLTEIHGIYPGDTYFPKLNRANWATTERREFPMTDSRRVAYTFNTLERIR